MLLVVVGVNGYLFYQQLPSATASFLTGETASGAVPVKDAGADEDPAPEARVPETTTQAAPVASERPEATASDSATIGRVGAMPVGLDDLRGIVRGCEDDKRECVQGAVEEAVSGARYLGGREDLSTDEPGGDTEVFYFEASGLEPCESVTEEYRGEDATYRVILMGEGTFESEEGAECIPTA